MRVKFAIAMFAIAMLCISSMAQENTTDYWLRSSQSLIANGSGYNIEQASHAYDKAIQLDPNNIDAWLGKAQSLTYLGKHNESLETFQKALDLTNETLKENPEDAKAWQNRGIALASLDRNTEANSSFEKSIEILNQSIQKNPKNAEAWWLKAENLEILGKTEATLEAYDKVIELNSSKAVGAWIRKSDIFLGQPGGYNKSLYTFDRAIELLPINNTFSFVSFWYNEKNSTIVLNEWLANGQIIRADLGRYNKSIQAYDDVVQTDSNLVAMWQSKGRAITPQGKSLGKHNEYLLGSSLNWVTYHFPKANEPGYNDTSVAQLNTAGYWITKGDDLALNKSNNQEALTAYEKATQIDPENMDAWGRKAVVLYILDQQAYRKVLNLSEKRLARNPHDALAWQTRAAALANLERQEEANQSLKKALEIYDQEIKDNPKNATAWYYKAALAANQTEALSAYEKVIELNGSRKVDALIIKGNILLNLGKYDESLAAIDRAVQLDPENFDAWNEKAIYYNIRGKYNESLAAFEKLIELKPENALAWESKGDALKALGRQAEADAAYAKAKDLGYQE